MFTAQSKIKYLATKALAMSLVTPNMVIEVG